MVKQPLGIIENHTVTLCIVPLRQQQVHYPVLGCAILAGTLGAKTGGTVILSADTLEKLYHRTDVLFGTVLACKNASCCPDINAGTIHCAAKQQFRRSIPPCKHLHKPAAETTVLQFSKPGEGDGTCSASQQRQ